MNPSTNFKGRLRNTCLPLTNGLMPLFEAVVNSIHAIEEAEIPMEKGKINIEIIRGPKEDSLNFDDMKRHGPEAKSDISGFVITDNGVGFDEKNMESFNTLDSEHKMEKGGRGIGRLLWLKAFKKVRIKSVFRDADEKLKQRSFEFNNVSWVSGEKIDEVDGEENTGTIVELCEFENRYRAYTRKTGKSIADMTLGHCLWYFLRPGGAPQIYIKDEEEELCLDNTFDAHMYSATTSEQITIKGKAFELIHAKLTSNSLSAHTIAFCADQRLVSEEKLNGKITGLHGRIPDGDNDFIYSCYVTSPFLDEYVRPERSGFDIEESFEELLEKTEITFSDIREAVIEKSKTYLNTYLAGSREKAQERVTGFVAKRAPRYRPILSRIPSDQLDVDPNISDKDLELTLHKHFASLEAELIAEGNDIIGANPGEDFEDYETRLKDYLSKAEDIKRSDLAGYVSHRRVILDLFEKALQRRSDGNYEYEKVIHQLIMPMKMDSVAAPLNAGNLWLVDERLAFHEYLASDQPLCSMPVTGANDLKRPDICVLHVFDQPILFTESDKMPPVSLEIFEIKRPMRNDAEAGEEKDPIEQTILYLQKIRDGQITTMTGRPISGAEKVPGFCYVLADLTPKLIERCKMHNLTLTSDGLGYFGYKPNYSAYIEVISFDRLLNMAKERNRAFFDKLGLPAN